MRVFTPLMIEKEIFQKNYQKRNQEKNNLQSFSPREIDSQEMGPQERELSRELMNYVLTSIQSLKFSDQKEIDDAIKIYQDKWLHQPQGEPSGKTAWQIILEERKKLGNPRKYLQISSIFFINIK